MRFLILIIGLCLVSGCSQGVVVEDDEAAAEEPEARKPLLGRKTGEIGKFDPNADQEISDSKGTYSNPITGPLEMYGPIVEKFSKQQIDYLLRLYHAEHGEYPQSYEEFMAKIVKPNNLKLPELPGGLKYEYDEANHKLVVVRKPNAE